MEIKYTKFNLPNSVRAVLVPRKETKAVYIEIMFKVGSRYETDDIRGISHFLEHMAFKGTKKRPTYVEVNKEIDQYGGSYNAYTGLDVTGFWVRLPSEKLELGLEFLSDIIFNSTYDKNELSKEKTVILEEIKMRADNPQVLAFIKFHNLVFGDTPLGSDIIGNENTVRDIDRKKLIDFRNHFYKTNNMVIAIGGNQKIAESKRLIEKYFHTIKGKVEDSCEKNVVVQNSPIVKVYNRKETKQAKLVMGFRSFGRNGSDQDRTVRSLLALILGGYSSSKLNLEIREKRGLCYSIGSDIDIFDETGVFEMGGGFDPDRLPEALKHIFKIIRDVKKNGFSTKEIKMGKDNRTGRLILGLENAGGWSSNIADQTLNEKDIELPEQTIKRIKKTTNSDIKKIAREVFRPENLNMVIVGPIDSKEEKKYLDLIKL